MTMWDKLKQGLGVTPKIIEEQKPKTAEEQRREVMPITKKYSLQALLDTCHQLSQSPNQKGRRITFEYVMLDGVNDSDEDARRLVKLIEGSVT